MIGEEVEEVNGLGVGHCGFLVFLKDTKDAQYVCSFTQQSLDLVNHQGLSRSGARLPVGFLVHMTRKVLMAKDQRSELQLAQSWDHGFKGPRGRLLLAH